MAKFNEIHVDTFVQVVRPGQVNAKARVVGKTAKKVRVQIMEKGKYIKDEAGEIVKNLVDPKNIKLYRKEDKEVVAEVEAPAAEVEATETEATEAVVAETAEIEVEA